MKAGEKVTVSGTVLRVDGTRVDLQTPDGQLIQTNVKNVKAVETKVQKTNGKNEGRKGPVGYATRG
jgi:hypothetical protein